MARLARRWTKEDVAAALIQLSADLAEAEPGITANHVSKWERGTRCPSPYYRPRLCLLFEATPEVLGFDSTPTLNRDIGELAGRRVARQHRLSAPTPSLPRIDHVDAERLRATLTRLWPVDGPLLAGLSRASLHLAERRDTEAPSAVVPAHQALLDVHIDLVSRPQRSDHGCERRRIAAFTGQTLTMACWVAGDAARTYRTYAIAESLAPYRPDGNVTPGTRLRPLVDCTTQRRGDRRAS